RNGHKQDFYRWLKQHKPDVILTHDVIGKETISEWLEQEGYDIPNDIGIVKLELVHGLESTASGVAPPYKQLGSWGVDLMVNQLYTSLPMTGPHQRGVYPHGQWHSGQTTRKQPS
ncbi:MAG: hypothetical protein AAF558_04885, partial [Verrucomicrobiota bacterium]